MAGSIQKTIRDRNDLMKYMYTREVVTRLCKKLLISLISDFLLQIEPLAV